MLQNPKPPIKLKPKKPGLAFREAQVRGDEAGVDTYDLEKGESVPDFVGRVKRTRAVHRSGLERQRSLQQNNE